MRCRLEAADRTFSNFGSGHQFGNHGPERLLIGLEPLETLVEDHAISDSDEQQDRNQALDQESEPVAHGASIRLADPSAPSNMTNVVLGFRSGFATRTETRSPTRPMRPSVRVTSPHRTATRASGLISSASVSPT